MAMEMQNLIFLTVLATLIPVAYSVEGTANYYTQYVPSTCKGSESTHTTPIAAVGDKIWENGAACGKFYRVKCIGSAKNGAPNPCKGNGTIYVSVVERCPSPGCQTTFDLTKKDWPQIADISAGIIKIDYEEVKTLPPGVEGVYNYDEEEEYSLLSDEPTGTQGPASGAAGGSITDDIGLDYSGSK